MFVNKMLYTSQYKQISMFSKKLFLSLLLIALIISVGCVNAVDSSNWKTVKVNDVDFKIPPKYTGQTQSLVARFPLAQYS